MHGERWNDGLGSGNEWWMAIMMIAVVAALAWITVTVLRHGRHDHSHMPTSSPESPSRRPTPQEILAERLAHGEIEPEEYRKRLAALQEAAPQR